MSRRFNHAKMRQLRAQWFKPCPTCDANGQYWHNWQNPFTGKTHGQYKKCKDCGGTGRVTDQEYAEIVARVLREEEVKR